VNDQHQPEAEEHDEADDREELSPLASRIVALCAALLVAGVALWAGLRILAYRADLDPPDPELAGLPASDAARAAGRTERLARRVVVFIVDGLTVTESRSLPTIEELRAKGSAFVADAGFPTFSRPAYQLLMTGVDQDAGGVRINEHQGASRFDNVFTRAHAAGLKTAAVGNSVPWIGELFGADLDLNVFGAGFERALQDALDPRYALVVVHLAETDKAAHHHGATSPEYRAAARAADARIARVVQGLDLQRDAVVVVADHGHRAAGGHGGVEPEVKLVPLVFAGAGVRRAPEGQARLVDVAPTVAALLGLPPPGQLRGKPLLDSLELSEQERAAVWQSMFWARARAERFMGGLWRARRALDVKRDEAMKLLAAGHYDTAYRTGEAIVREEAERAAAYHAKRLAAARLGRAWPLGIGLLLVFAALVVLGRRRIIEPGAAALLAPLGPALAAGAYLVLFGAFSFSVIRDRDVFIARLALIGVGAAVAHFALLAAALGPRGPRRARRAAGLALWSTLVAALPALACHVMVGPGRVLDLPSPLWTYLPLVCYPLAVVMGGAAALFVLLEGRARE
jgi:hypothetical protein